MKGHVIKVTDIIKMFPNLIKNGLTKYRFAEGEDTCFLVMVNDVAALISDHERRVMLSTCITYFDTLLIPVVI